MVLGSSRPGALARLARFGLVRRARCPVAVIHSDDAVILIRSAPVIWSTVRRFPELARPAVALTGVAPRRRAVCDARVE